MSTWVRNDANQVGTIEVEYQNVGCIWYNCKGHADIRLTNGTILKDMCLKFWHRIRKKDV